MQSKSLTRGAEVNEITASAASQHIQELEKNLGVVLLDRSTRPFSLTREGRLYYDMCRDVLRRWDEFDAALGHIRQQVRGEVRVASIYSIGLTEMSQLEQAFSRREPDAELTVEYLRPEKVYEAVASDQVDLGLVSYPAPTRDIAVIPWRQEEMAVITAPEHPLTLQHRVRPQDLEGLNFVAFDDDLPIRRAVDEYLAEHSVEVNVTMHFDNIQMIKEAVAIGSGVSICPTRIMKAELANGRLVSVPLASPGLQRPLGIIHRKRKKLAPAAESFLRLLQEAPVDERALVG